MCGVLEFMGRQRALTTPLRRQVLQQAWRSRGRERQLSHEHKEQGIFAGDDSYGAQTFWKVSWLAWWAEDPGPGKARGGRDGPQGCGLSLMSSAVLSLPAV
jgi:hypothetical protein